MRCFPFTGSSHAPVAAWSRRVVLEGKDTSMSSRFISPKGRDNEPHSLLSTRKKKEEKYQKWGQAGR